MISLSKSLKIENREGNAENIEKIVQLIMLLCGKNWNRSELSLGKF